MVQKHRIRIRAACRCQHGMCAETEKHGICVEKTVGKVWKAVDCGGGYFVCVSGSRSGHPLHAECGRSGGSHDFHCARLSFRGSALLPGWHETFRKGTVILRACLSAQGYGAGCHRFRAYGNGAFLRKNRAFRGGAGYFNHGSAGGVRH